MDIQHIPHNWFSSIVQSGIKNSQSAVGEKCRKGTNKKGYSLSYLQRNIGICQRGFEKDQKKNQDINNQWIIIIFSLEGTFSGLHSIGTSVYTIDKKIVL